MMSNNDTLATLIVDLASGRLRVVDLTQPLSPDTPVIQLPPEFAASPPFTINELSHYDDRGPGWYWSAFACGEHTGTHFDAPVHWVTGKDHDNNRTDNILSQRFIGPACVIDVIDEVAADPDLLLTPERLESWEKEHGRIPAGAWVLLCTNWSKRTGADEFLNAGEDGPHSPGPDTAAVRFLIEERDVLGFGNECVGTDAGQAFGFEPAFPCHTLMHGANKFGLASLANLDQLPPTGAVVIAAPLKIVNGSGSPLRVLALAPAG